MAYLAKNDKKAKKALFCSINGIKSEASSSESKEF